MAETQTQRTARIRAEVAQMRQQHRQEYAARTREITNRWSTGFAQLKAENDQMQKDLKEWNQLDNLQIQNYYRENMSAKGPY